MTYLHLQFVLIKMSTYIVHVLKYLLTSHFIKFINAQGFSKIDVGFVSGHNISYPWY